MMLFFSIFLITPRREIISICLSPSDFFYLAQCPQGFLTTLVSLRSTPTAVAESISSLAAFLLTGERRLKHRKPWRSMKWLHYLSFSVTQFHGSRRVKISTPSFPDSIWNDLEMMVGWIPFWKSLILKSKRTSSDDHPCGAISCLSWALAPSAFWLLDGTLTFVSEWWGHW